MQTSSTTCHDGTASGRKPNASSRRNAPAVRPSPQHLSRGDVALSIRMTSRPARANVIAAAAPAGPPPTTQTSARSNGLVELGRQPDAGDDAGGGEGGDEEPSCLWQVPPRQQHRRQV